MILITDKEIKYYKLLDDWYCDTVDNRDFLQMQLRNKSLSYNDRLILTEQLIADELIIARIDGIFRDVLIIDVVRDGE